MKPQNDYEKMVEDPERARVFTRLLYNYYKNAKNEFADLIDLTGIERIMDVGGGSGAVSILLAHKYPDLRSVVVDLKMFASKGEGLWRKIIFQTGSHSMAKIS